MIETATCNLSAFAVCRAAQECVSFQDAAQQLQVSDLGAILAESPALRAAWDHGRFLRRLGEFGATPFCLAEVAKRLGLGDEAAFRQVLDADAEAADVFQRARDSLCIGARASLLQAASAGHAHAIRAMERLLKVPAATSAESTFDHTAVNVTTLARITGIAPMQWSRWERAGLPRAPDGTFNLCQAVAWIRRNPGRATTRKYRQRRPARIKRLSQHIAAMIETELACRDGDGQPENEKGDSR